MKWVNKVSDIVKNQHYIPQSVLKHFSSNEKVYEALVGEKKDPYPTHFRNSMSERFTYEHPNLALNQLEKFFQDVEADYAPAIVEALRLIELCENGEETIDAVKKHVQAYLDAIIIYYYRSGALLHEFGHETAKKEIRISLLLDKLMNTSYINNLGKTLMDFYEFALIKSEQNHFLISDQYISTVALRIKSRFANISNRHLGLKDVMILVPLSSQ
jgi:phosphatidylserine/phosphatidylglycerophosphate/cardiolipin synthase-like enzyme